MEPRVKKMTAFSSLVRQRGYALIASCAALGTAAAIALAVNHWIDNRAQADLMAEYALVQNAQNTAGAERQRLEEIDGACQASISSLRQNEGAAKALLGIDPDAAWQTRQSAYLSGLARIGKATSTQKAIEDALRERGSHLLGGRFYEMSKPIRDFAQTPEASELDARYSGYASAPLRSFSEKIAKAASEIPGRLASLRSALKSKLADPDASLRQIDQNLEASAALFHRELLSLADRQTEQAVQGYENQVLKAAEEAFAREGESMSSSDRDDILGGFRSDPDFANARDGLYQAAYENANHALETSAAALAEQAELAKAAVARKPDPDSMPVAEAAALAYWLSADAEARSFSAMDRSQALRAVPFAQARFSAWLAPSYAYQNPQGPGAAYLKLSGPAQAAVSKSLLSNRLTPSKPAFYSRSLAGAAASAAKAASAAAGSAASRAASSAAGSAASRAASAAAGNAASRAASAAAGNAASRAASAAASRAASAAASRAASSAAARSAASSSMRSGR